MEAKQAFTSAGEISIGSHPSTDAMGASAGIAMADVVGLHISNLQVLCDVIDVVGTPKSGLSLGHCGVRHSISSGCC